MKNETREVWVAEDGRVFDTQAACAAHEKEVLERKQALAGLKVWRVTHGFDETEGRGYFACTYVISDADYPVLLQWCLDTFGPPLVGWYGGGFYEAWHLSGQEMSATEAMKRRGQVLWSYHSPVKVAVVSQKDWTWAEMPKSEFPWPRKKATTK